MTEPEPQALSEEDQQRRRRTIAELMPTTPFIESMGLLIEEYEPDRAAVRIPFRHDLTNDGVVYHGGVIAAALDTCGALAAWSDHDFAKGHRRASTISMSVQYVGAARSSDLRCTAVAVKRGKELIFTEITATDAEGLVVAHAVQTYRIA